MTLFKVPKWNSTFTENQYKQGGRHMNPSLLKLTNATLKDNVTDWFLGLPPVLPLRSASQKMEICRTSGPIHKQFSENALNMDKECNRHQCQNKELSCERRKFYFFFNFKHEKSSCIFLCSKLIVYQEQVYQQGPKRMAHFVSLLLSQLLT